MVTAIWWIRRDLRLYDNQALHAALARAERLLPLFVLDPHLLEGPARSPRRNAFLLAALRSLDAELQRRGSALTVVRGDPVTVVPELARALRATVVAEEDATPYAQRRDRSVGLRCPLLLVPGSTIRPLGSVRTPHGTAYRIYTQFVRAWRALPQPSCEDLLPAPPVLPPPPAEIAGKLSLTETAEATRFEASEAAARQRLARFLSEGIARYHESRNLLDGSGSSQLSPYFRFGLLSVREAYCRAAHARSVPEAAQGAQAWVGELLWREFYYHLLALHPEFARTSMHPAFQNRPWPGDLRHLAAWQQGETGYPVVDAAMRQLVTEGWISNRARMIVANFLTKLLLIDWRRGERFFRQQLLDGDLAANAGGWQWSAGTGTDAAPYFRIFNPVVQGQRYDPEGTWVRRWVPELADIPTDYLYAPWRMPPLVQQAARCVIGQDYPAPIVDYATARHRALAWFRLVLGRSDDGDT
ncbi:deoxyribodipyrimidine photo-lyase [Thermomicrobium sp. 4228-Ro]|uniref:cryptochrome/photolyase family protein n=1 Tax=Thermomicrobium sp. 4228-Ro TaxID=2993937 RepID=UPI0022499E42|nr:deoxyribodipyrimidine photo-lyase [Thermomicrobium sp. 4228-Ro]MCX2726594.1 deoxyribodipyrimidine photo-lyase [Thermomicrobium sp. 4228-Ro]